jgi:pyruvate-formate lyase-activating enzyme
VGLKAWDNDLHRALTGRERETIFQNVAAAYGAGMDIKINVVFIPGLVDVDQVEAIAAWLAAIDRNIPFHIMRDISLCLASLIRSPHSDRWPYRRRSAGDISIW